MRTSVVLAKKYLSIAAVTAPTYWTESAPLARAQMEYEDECAHSFLEWFPEESFAGKDVFDIGCGYGGRPVRFLEQGARRVTGLEIADKAINEAREFAARKGFRNAEFVVGFGERLPFPDASFDLITSNDVFEHVADLRQTLLECIRVLRPGGRLRAIFPPFYHPTGSHLDSWVSRMPWPNVLFRCETLVRAVPEILRERNDDYKPTPMRPGDRLWTLNGATVKSVRRLLADLPDCDSQLKLAPLFSSVNRQWEPWRMKYYAFAFKPLRWIPVLQELFVHRIVLTIVRR